MSVLSKAKGFFSFEEAEANEELKCEIDLSKVETEELSRLQFIKYLLSRTISELDEIGSSTTNARFEAERGIRTVIGTLPNLLEEERVSKDLSGRLWSECQTFLKNLRRLNYAYRSDPRVRKLEEFEGQFIREFSGMRSILKIKRKRLKAFQQIIEKYQSTATSIKIDRAALIDCIRLIDASIMYTEQVQKFLRELEGLSIGEEHLLKQEEHQLLKR